MKQLVQELVDSILKEDARKVTAIYGGGFKPPIKGHFKIAQEALKDLSEIDKLMIYVGGGIRDGIEQEEALAIWDIYKEVLGPKVEPVPSVAPIGDIMRYAKDHPDELVYFVIGYREGREDDLKDIASRTKGIEEKYPNLEVKVIKTDDPNISGTNARKALKKGDKETFFTFLPDEIPANEKEEIYNLVSKSIVSEHMAHSNTTDILSKCAELTNYMRSKGYNIDPAPALKVIDSDVDNSQDFFGKTAYYDPNEQLIVLYTQGRHPKDIVRSYAHEMIHHIQNVEDRLGNIVTTNTSEDDHLEDIEREAYEEGNIAFRNWTDSLQEGKVKDPFGIMAYAYELARLGEEVIFENEELNTLSLYSPQEIRSMNLPKGGGIYFWWVNSEAAAVIDRLSPNAQVGMCQKRDINGEEYSLVYVGLAKNLNQRVKDWHINQKHSDSAVRSGFISTLRHTIAAVLGQNLYAQEAINDFQNNYMLVGFIETEDYKNEELKFIGSCSLPLNIRDNKNHPFYKELKALRKISKQNSKEQLNEGRYDKFTNQISRIVFEMFKNIHDRGDKEGEFEFRVDHPDEEHDIPSEDFYFDLMGKVEITDDEYKVDGGANAGFDDEGDEITPMLAVKFKIPKNPDWQKVSFDIKDVVRHELEHLTQDGENVKGVVIDPKDPRLNRPGKQMDDDQFIRDMIDADFLPKADYFKLEKEIDAMLQGLYFKAKKSRTPFKTVIDDYLSTQPIDNEEKAIILDLWRNRRKALSLPLFEAEDKGEVMTNYTIYSDMDGVLSDFDKRFMEFSKGVAPDQYEKKYGVEKFWELIDGEVGVPFWAGMDWMNDGKQYWDYIKKYDPIILSAPSRNEESKYGKRIWKKRNMPTNKMILVPAWKKQEYASPTSILIDDREKNIQQWEDAGGIGILHTSAANTIAQLKKLGL